MIVRTLLLIAIVLAVYILWTHKSTQEQQSEDAANQLSLRVLLIGLGILGSVVIFVIAAELITRL